MCIVLGKAADTGQSVELAALLIAVNGTEFGKTEREVAIGARFAAEDFAMVRAVHWLEHILLALLRGLDRLERVLAVFCVVSAGYIEVLGSYVRGHYRQIAEFLLLAAEEGLEGIAHLGAAWQPQRQTETHPSGEGEELHLLAELAMVALLCFFEHDKVFVKHALFREGDTVDSGELLPALVAFPVGSGDGGKLHRLDVVHVQDVRATAKAREISVLIKCNRSVFEVRNELQLVRVALFGEIFDGIGLADLAALEGFF